VLAIQSESGTFIVFSGQPRSVQPGLFRLSSSADLQVQIAIIIQTVWIIRTQLKSTKEAVFGRLEHLISHLQR
jgi:hypothetical protein